MNSSNRFYAVLALLISTRLAEIIWNIMPTCGCRQISVLGILNFGERELHYEEEMNSRYILRKDSYLESSGTLGHVH